LHIKLQSQSLNSSLQYRKDAILQNLAKNERAVFKKAAFSLKMLGGLNQEKLTTSRGVRLQDFCSKNAGNLGNKIFFHCNAAKLSKTLKKWASSSPKSCIHFEIV